MTSDRLIAGRYRLTDPIGTGAMGVVWRATDVRLRRTVAVKQVLLAPGLTGTQALEGKLRAMREGRIAARLHHPNAITVFDVAEEDGQPWLVMEYMNAPSLAAKLAGGVTLPPIEVAGIGAQAAAALSAAHDAGIMHRDVKPANLLVGDDGTVKLTDFGISHATGDVTVTATGFLAGTPAYLAPEIARGDSPKPAADVFALGSTLYAASEGAPPFGEGDNPLAVLHAVARGVVPEPKNAGPLAPVLMWLLTASADDRPTMAQARVALEDVAAGRVPALPASATKILPMSEAATTQIPSAGAPANGGATAKSGAAALFGSGLAKAKAARSAISGRNSTGASSGAPRASDVGGTAASGAGAHMAGRPDEVVGRAAAGGVGQAGAVRQAAAGDPGLVRPRDAAFSAADGVERAGAQAQLRAAAAAGPTDGSGLHPAFPVPPSRTDRANNSRAVLLLAAAVAAFTVMLVVLVVTRDRGGERDQQAQVPASPVTVTTMVDGKVSTVVIVPEQETITVSAPSEAVPSGATTTGATPTSTSAKPTPTTPKPSSTTVTTTQAGPPTPDRINQFIAGYYGMLPGNIGGAWAQLAPGYQAQTGGFGQYSSFWSSVRSVTVGSITPSGPNRAVVTLTYQLANGTVTSENRWIQVAGDAGNLQIAGSGV
ncbi:serine/threonine-protein kinase [Nocardia sp. PE-7]|uniref:serine/threonine-protein kinase n=1 Tax=Nocardia sp. PE-7 TaxID=3058426 RepID=UPI002657BB1E|nr:serine/threonine-protein kinase [Nocardia sp. PE-7]WKG07167.1 serine/threonine-protein kinase [Nocardia sp. PE-7]